MAIGETLVAKSVITAEQLQKALDFQSKNPDKRLGDIIVELGFATKEQIEKALS